MGFINIARYIGVGSVETIAAVAPLTRAIMLGSAGIIMSDLTEVDVDTEYVKLEYDLREERLQATAGIALTLYGAGFGWTMRKMAMKQRAALVANMAARIVEVVESMQNGKQIDKIRRTRGINQLRGSIIGYTEKVSKMKTTDDALNIIFMGEEIKAQIHEIRLAYSQFDDTMATLQYANQLGDGAYIYPKGHENAGKLVNHTNSIFDAKDIGRMQDIADSQKVFSREYATSAGRGHRVGAPKIRPFANKDIAMAAEMFLPTKEAADDLFNIYEDVMLARANMDDIMEGVAKAGTMFDEFAKTIITPQGLLVKNISIAEIKAKAVMLMGLLEGKTKGIWAASNQIDEMLTLKMLPKIATAELAAESWILRGTGKVVSKGVELGIRLSNASKLTNIGADKVATTATRAGQGAKFIGKGLGYVLLIDSVIWITTGLYDLAFVEDEGDSYLANHWGFSPVGWLIDSTIELAFGKEAVEDFHQALADVVVDAIQSDTLSGMVSKIVDFYVGEFNLEVLPFDFAFDMDFDGNFDLSKLFKGAFDLNMILEVGIYAIVIKLVVMQWLVPLWGEVGRSVVG